MVYVFTCTSFKIVRKRTLLILYATIEETLTTVLYYVVDDILCRSSFTIFRRTLSSFATSIRLRPKVYVEITGSYYPYFRWSPRFPSTSRTSWGPIRFFPILTSTPCSDGEGVPAAASPPPPKLIGHHRAAGRWLQDGSYLYLFWKPRWRAGSAQVWPPRGAAGARNMGPRTPLTPLRKLWPSSLEYSCESTCE